MNNQKENTVNKEDQFPLMQGWQTFSRMCAYINDKKIPYMPMGIFWQKLTFLLYLHVTNYFMGKEIMLESILKEVCLD